MTDTDRSLDAADRRLLAAVDEVGSELVDRAEESGQRSESTIIAAELAEK